MNSDGKITLNELTNALDAAFPDMPAWAKEHIPLQFTKYARPDTLWPTGETGLDMERPPRLEPARGYSRLRSLESRP